MTNSAELRSVLLANGPSNSIPLSSGSVDLHQTQWDIWRAFGKKTTIRVSSLAWLGGVWFAPRYGKASPLTSLTPAGCRADLCSICAQSTPHHSGVTDWFSRAHVKVIWKGPPFPIHPVYRGPDSGLLLFSLGPSFSQHTTTQSTTQPFLIHCRPSVLCCQACLMALFGLEPWRTNYNAGSQ